MVILMMVSISLLVIRLGYLMLAKSEYYLNKAEALHERERSIKAKRGAIYDRNGVELAGNKAVCSVSVIHSQVKDPEQVIRAICSVLELDEKVVRKKVEANTIREKIKSNVEKKTADILRDMNLDGVMIDEDYKRYYPYDTLASKVIGFTGSDNQGIVGLEVYYDELLQGEPGSILTLTDAHGKELKNEAENRIAPVPGQNLYLSIDVNIQKYAQQAAIKVLKSKQAKRVSVVLMNPQNGEIYAMVNVPEYDLNQPYQLVQAVQPDPELMQETHLNSMSEEEKSNALNAMWRNFCINDSYEPGSTFKTVTATAALEEGVVSVNDTFSCPGFRIVEDRKIRCHKVAGHGIETFREGIMNSCNPVFMDVGARVGAVRMYENYRKLGLFERTGVDLPGEASSIMHKLENVQAVELATMSFGQSVQITPLQLLRAASAIVNGGKLVTPHFGMCATDGEGNVLETFSYPEREHVISEHTSAVMRELLEAVVAEGSGNKGQVPGYRVGGKTATSEKLPRGNKKYISSFMGFAPANQPCVIGLILIDEPEGVYYGGTIAAPVMAEIFSNVLPYLGIEAEYSEKELQETSTVLFSEDFVE